MFTLASSELSTMWKNTEEKEAMEQIRMESEMWIHCYC
jgi:hypothetical protein